MGSRAGEGSSARASAPRVWSLGRVAGETASPTARPSRLAGAWPRAAALGITTNAATTARTRPRRPGMKGARAMASELPSHQALGGREPSRHGAVHADRRSGATRTRPRSNSRDLPPRPNGAGGRGTRQVSWLTGHPRPAPSHGPWPQWSPHGVAGLVAVYSGGSRIGLGAADVSRGTAPISLFEPGWRIQPDRVRGWLVKQRASDLGSGEARALLRFRARDCQRRDRALTHMFRARFSRFAGVLRVERPLKKT